MHIAPLRWLLVGAGDIARKRVAPALQAAPGSRLMAVCAAHHDRALDLASTVGANVVYDDFERALADPQIDAVYIATPVSLHVPQTIRALEKRKHVLVEKPLGLNAQSALLAAAKARESGVLAGCAYYRRCYPSYSYARDLLAAGGIGSPILFRASYGSWFNPREDDPKYWRVRPAQSGGGPLADMGSHMLDLLVGLAGLPRTVFAKVTTQTHSYEVEDSSSYLLSFANGAIAQGSFHWNSRSWSHEMEIVGTEGRLKWSPFDSGIVLRTVGRNSEQVCMPNEGNVHLPVVSDFVNAVRDRREPIAPLQEAAKTNLILDAIYTSAASGREICL